MSRGADPAGSRFLVAFQAGEEPGRWASANRHIESMAMNKCPMIFGVARMVRFNPNLGVPSEQVAEDRFVRTETDMTSTTEF